jgi:hypothetical protein
MKVRFEAFEENTAGSPDPITELLVDDVRIFRRGERCAGFTPGETLPPNEVGNTLLADRSGMDVALVWSAPPVDAGHDPARFYPIYRSGTPDGGFQQIGDPANTAFHDMDAGMSGGEVLYYVVAARNAAGDSGEAPVP